MLMGEVALASGALISASLCAVTAVAMADLDPVGTRASPDGYRVVGALTAAAAATALAVAIPLALLQGCCDALGVLWNAAYQTKVERHLVPPSVRHAAGGGSPGRNNNIVMQPLGPPAGPGDGAAEDAAEAVDEPRDWGFGAWDDRRADNGRPPHAARLPVRARGRPAAGANVAIPGAVDDPTSSSSSDDDDHDDDDNINGLRPPRIRADRNGYAEPQDLLRDEPDPVYAEIADRPLQPLPPIGAIGFGDDTDSESDDGWAAAAEEPPSVRDAWGAPGPAAAADNGDGGIRPASWGGEASRPRRLPPLVMPEPLSPTDEDHHNTPISPISPQQMRGICVVCTDAMANCVIRPCKHLCVCEECMSLMVANALAHDQPPKCPLCNGAIEDTDTLFIS